MRAKRLVLSKLSFLLFHLFETTRLAACLSRPTWVNLDFGVLVRAHALEIKRNLRNEHNSILKERPLTHAEKEYKEMIDVAAVGKRRN